MRIHRKLLKFVRCEFLRFKESNGGSTQNTQAVEAEIRDQHLPVHQAIVIRANRLLGEDDKAQLEQPLRQYRRLQFLFMGLLFVLGGLAANQVFSGVRQASANFFWILLGLLGVNAVSLIVWMILIFIKNSADFSGAWMITIQRWLSRLNPESQNALRAWHSGLFHPKARRWQVSVISHQLWFSFLVGGLLMAILLLSTRQYEFVWETTILEPETFVAITQWLSALPSMFGISAPSAEQVLSSRIGADQVPFEPVRTLWSNLLLSSLLLYGIFPRTLALIASLAMRYLVWNKLSPDWQIPYYHQLGLRLAPTAISGGVIDADSQAGQDKDRASVAHGTSIKPLMALTGIGLIGLEWGESWPPQTDIDALAGLKIEHTGVDVIDRASRQRAIQFIDDIQPNSVLLLGRFISTPDRGIIQWVKQITDRHSSVWLLLINHNNKVSDNRRWRDWLDAAEKANLESSHICSIDIERRDRIDE